MKRQEIIAELVQSIPQSTAVDPKWAGEEAPATKRPNLCDEVASILERIERSGCATHSGGNKRREYIGGDVPLDGYETSAYDINEEDDKEDLFLPLKMIADQIIHDHKEGELVVVLVVENDGTDSRLLELTSMLPDRMGDKDIDFDRIKVDRFNNPEGQLETKIRNDLSVEIKDRNVVLLQVSIGTGCTTADLLTHLQTKSPASIKVCTIFNDTSIRAFGVPVDYSVLDLEQKAVIGIAKNPEFCFPYIAI